MAKPGLYANIHAKRRRIAAGSGEKMRKAGAPGAPTAANFKRQQRLLRSASTQHETTSRSCGLVPQIQSNGRNEWILIKKSSGKKKKKKRSSIRTFIPKGRMLPNHGTGVRFIRYELMSNIVIRCIRKR